MDKGLSGVWKAIRALRDETLPFDKKDQYLNKLEDAFYYATQIEGELYTDAVTGGKNRKAFMQELSNAIENISANPDKEYTLIFVDLDGFKQVNDTHGHDAGDEALWLADLRLLDGATDGKGVVARLGGDEFVVLMDSADMQDTSLEHIRRITAKTFIGLGEWDIDTDEYSPILGSVGVHHLSKEDMGNKTVSAYAAHAMSEADKSMYADKATKTGRLAAAKAAAEDALKSEPDW